MPQTYRSERDSMGALQVPADAELVIEGFIDPMTLEPEAPFGESNGYVALEAYNMPMQVTAITHRKNAVFSAIISQVTPSESSVVKKVAYEPLFLYHLRDTMGVRGVPRVIEDPEWLHAQISALTDQQEAGRADPWQVSDAPPDFIAGLVRGIVGIEIPVTAMAERVTA